MGDFTISVAAIPVRIMPLHPDIRRYFSEYLCDEAPRFSVAVTEEDLETERVYAERTWSGERALDRPWAKPTLEVASLLRKIAARMPEYDTILMHGSAVAAGGRAYLFTAPSGTGKTTHSRLWLEQIPGSYILNGDKPFLKVLPDGSVLACGVPWRGKERLGRSGMLPLEAICLLERAEVNRIVPLEPKEAMDGLLRQTNLPDEPAAVLKTLQLLDRISRGVRLFRLGCNMDPEAARVSSEAMIPK